MTEPTPNLPLLRKILDHIDAHPEEHDQRGFEDVRDCGTTRCIAGWAEYFTNGQVTHSEARAQEALGLTEREANDMFFGTLVPTGLGVPDAPGEEYPFTASRRAAVQIVAKRIAARAGEVL